MARYYYDDEFPEYVSVDERRRKAEREAANLKSASPVMIKGSQIATTFWGKSWCQNLERYSDYSNRRCIARGSGTRISPRMLLPEPRAIQRLFESSSTRSHIRTQRLC